MDIDEMIKQMGQALEKADHFMEGLEGEARDDAHYEEIVGAQDDVRSALAKYRNWSRLHQ